MWNPSLEYQLTSEILPGDGPGQPKLDDVGIRLGAQDVAYDGKTLRFRLLATYGLPLPLYRAYQVVEWAIRVVLECPQTGQSGVFNLQDPFAEFAPLSGPNYKGDPPAYDKDKADIAGGALGVDVAVPLPDAAAGPALYVTAHLQDVSSNTLAIDARSKSATSLERRG